MIKVKQEIEIYEINGEATPIHDAPQILISSHWNENIKVIITIEGKAYTVVGGDLIQATYNAMHTNRF